MRYAFDFDNLYRCIGSVCVHATWLEQELEDTITLIAGDDRVASIVRGQRGTNSVSAILRLLKDGAVGEEHRERIEAATREAGRLLEERDLIVHSVWLKKNGSRKGYILGTRTRATKTTRKEWSIPMLEVVVAKMERVQNRLGTVTHNAVAVEKGWGLMPVDDE